MRKLLFLLLVLVGCGDDTRIKTQAVRYEADVFFHEHITALEQRILFVTGISVTFRTPVRFSENLEEKHLGVCHGSNLGPEKRLIEINKQKFEKISLNTRDKYLAALLLHEFGHCDLLLDHNYEKATYDNPIFTWSKNTSYMSFINNRIGYEFEQRPTSVMWPQLINKWVSKNSYLDDQIKHMFIPDYEHEWARNITISDANNPKLSNIYEVYEQTGELVIETDSFSVFSEHLFVEELHSNYGYLHNSKHEEQEIEIID
jgi:hypothetical protein